jgi:hypothetical protein
VLLTAVPDAELDTKLSYFEANATGCAPLQAASTFLKLLDLPRTPVLTFRL